MFTGIIEKVGSVIEAEGPKLLVSSGFSDVVLGESIAVNGVCLTATEISLQGDLFFFVSPETLGRTNLGTLKAGSRVNLERALLPTTRLSGHLVQGHVDGLATLARITPQEGSFVVQFEIPTDLTRYCVEKGSVALNGVSLTINRILNSAQEGHSLLDLTLIPHTWEETQFSAALVGDKINVEVDILAKYAEKLCQPYPKP